MDRIQPLRKRITQLETEVRALRKQAQAQRQRIAQKCGYEFLALVDSDRNCKVTVIDVVQKLVFQDQEGNVISETDSSLVGKIIDVRVESMSSQPRYREGCPISYNFEETPIEKCF